MLTKILSLRITKASTPPPSDGRGGGGGSYTYAFSALARFSPLFRLSFVRRR